MAGNTFTWIGGSSFATIATNWSPTGGPDVGDIAIIPLGTVVAQLDAQLNSNIVEIGGTAGATAASIFTGDALVNYATPTFDAATVLDLLVPGHTTAESALLEAVGTFVNQGSILADGPAGSTFAINVQEGSVGGTALPGYFINYGEIIVEVGNTMTIAVAGTSELFNVGLLEADGGTLVINADPAAIVGGYAPVQGVAVIENGGTIEINNAYPSGFSGTAPANGGSAPYFVFGDARLGDTLKIDQVEQFGGRILGFQQGDTIDTGTLLTVGTITFDAGTGIMALEDATGTILASLVFSSGAFQTGTFTVSGGVANDVTLTTGSDGNTLLTTDLVNSVWDNSSGTWGTAGNWSTGTVPDSSATAVIGLGATNPFTVTTGATSVSANSLSVVNDDALLRITSNATVLPNFIQQIAGTVEVTGGNTLLTSGLRQFNNDASLLVDKNAVLDVTGHLNTNIAANQGTVGITNGNTVALFINGAAVVDGGTIAAGPSKTQTGGLIDIGQNSQGTPGKLTVQNGGTVIDTYANLSSDPTSFGSLTLTGAGTTWTDAGDAQDTQTTRGNMFVGNNNQSNSTPVPPFTAAAQLLVENSAVLTEATYAIIGNSADSGGSATITSNGTWNIGTSSTGGFLNIGNNGTGTLAVTAGGTVEIHSGTGTFNNSGTPFPGSGITIGNHPGSTGTVTVDGSGSLLTTQNGMSVGTSAQGELIIQNGGSVSIGNGSANGISVGNSLSAASGTIMVTGAASTLTDANGLGVGEHGQGTLSVQNGGTVTASGLGISEDPGGTGTVTVNGVGSMLNIGDSGIGVAKVAAGALFVMGGGVASSGLSGIGIANNVALTSGTIEVDGIGSKVSSTGGMGIGRTGQGTLVVQNGGSVDLIIGAGTNIANLNLGGFSSGPTGGTGFASAGSGGQIEIQHDLVVWQGSTAAVLDGTSGIDVGTSGAAQSGDILVEAGHRLYGDGVVNAAVQNNSTVASTNNGAFSSSTGGTLDINGAITGTGMLVLTKNSTLEVSGSLGVGQTVVFNAGTETLVLGTPGSGLANPLSGINVGDRIEFGGGMTIDTVTMLNTNTAEIGFHGSGGLPGTYDVTDINFTGTATQFGFGQDATTGDAFIQAAPPCFAAGTRIATRRGAVAVESLKVGDLIRVVSGEAPLPLVWIGHRRIDCRRHPDPRLVWPVRIRAGAFGTGLPGRDLWLSPDHAVYIGEVLIPVKYLINGGSIAQVPTDEVTYYHVELPGHSVLLAEGLPAESYLDTGDRANFSNGGGPIALYPDFSSRIWEAAGCAPLVVTGPTLDAARRWVGSRTASAA